LSALPHEYQSDPARGLKYVKYTSESAEVYNYIHVWEKNYNRRGRDSSQRLAGNLRGRSKINLLWRWLPVHPPWADAVPPVFFKNSGNSSKNKTP
jgi:hypothetical protein